jgi:transposase
LGTFPHDFPAQETASGSVKIGQEVDSVFLSSIKVKSSSSSAGLVAGNHNDAYNLKPHLQSAFGWIKEQGLSIQDVYFNADSAFDTQESRKTCFNHGLKPNIPENKRNRKVNKRGRKRIFNEEVYKHRFTSERSFAWIDKYRARLIRFDRRDLHFLNEHYIAFTMINIRHLVSEKG